MAVKQNRNKNIIILISTLKNIVLYYKMSGATIYIEQFDQAQNLDTLGRVDYRADFQAPTTDVKLRTLVDIDVIRAAFRFKSDGTDFEEETAVAKYVSGKDIIPHDTNDVNTHYGYYKEDDGGIAGAITSVCDSLFTRSVGAI